MLYIDTSCLVKLFVEEPESSAVARAVENEPCVVVSTLAELEALIELKARFKSGEFSKPQWRRYEFMLHHLRNQEPFLFQTIPPSIWDTAIRQHRNSEQIHCRTLDRLHLAAAEKFGLSRLMTHDEVQAAAALELGFEVIEPGR